MFLSSSQIHPLQFLGGEYNDQLYDDAVNTAARAFIGDPDLKEKVRHLATRMFQEMSAEGATTLEVSTLQHCGVTFKIVCGGCGSAWRQARPKDTHYPPDRRVDATVAGQNRKGREVPA